MKNLTLNNLFTGQGAELEGILPDDIAAANKAVSNSLLQIKNISNTTPAELAAVVATLETTKGLDQITSLTDPVPIDVKDYFLDTFGTGTGTNGTYLLADVLGTAAGWVHNDELPVITSVITALSDLGALDPLSADGGSASSISNGVYTVMNYLLSGGYNRITGIPPSEVTDYLIPVGVVGAGTYATRVLAMTALIAAAETRIAAIATAYPTLAAQSNAATDNMCNQLLREVNAGKKAGLQGDMFVPVTGTNDLILNFVQGLHQSGNDTSLGGSAWLLENVADLETRSGQAIVATMREGRNIQRLQSIGLGTSSFLESETRTTEQATLLDSTYTPTEAAALNL